VLIQEYSNEGYRRLWALLRHRLRLRANGETTCRVLQTRRSLMDELTVTSQPRLKASMTRIVQSGRR
jgi:hypothetical protein